MYNLNQFYQPARFAEIASLHKKAFNWEPQNRIPLGIHVVNPEYGKGLDYSDWLNPEPFFELQRRVLIDTLQVGSDLLPAVAINHLGDAVLTSMFGAQMLMPETSSATLQDIGPTPVPRFSSIEEVANLDLPDMDAGIMPGVLKIARYYRERLPEWVHVVPPMPAGPFSTAMELRGSGFLSDLIDRPDLCHKLIELSASLQAAVELRARAETHTPLTPMVTNFGILGTGLRLGEDSMVNLSPSAIREFCLPGIRTVNQTLGGRGHIHFCSLEHAKFEHVYRAFLDTVDVAVISSQLGFEYYARHLDELRGRLAVESFYGDGVGYVRSHHGSFQDWANDFVPRFKNESGLVLYCQATLEEGLEMWNVWKEAHER